MSAKAELLFLRDLQDQVAVLHFLALVSVVLACVAVGMCWLGWRRRK